MKETRTTTDIDGPSPAPRFADSDSQNSAAGQSLLITKLLPPQIRSEIVGRARLLQQLDRAADRRLILISTPPGYGKSTLAAQWVHASSRPFAWISLDETDNDPVSFFRYAVAAVQTFDDVFCAETARLLNEQENISVRTLATSFINELTHATKPFTLVLDDFHVIQSLEVIEGVKLLLANQPPMLRLLISTRSDPEFPLLRMRARGQLLELRATDIAFSLTESRELLCERLGLELTQTQLDQIHTWSEGWPVGLLLVGQMLQDRPDEDVDSVIDELSRNAQFIEDFLWSEVLERLSSERREFLLETSILDRFSIETCEAVTGSTQSHTLMRSIERENLFLSTVEADQRWYRYHHLFAEFLRQQLAREVRQERIEELHRRAANWYAKQNHYEVAARHAIAGKDWQVALELLAVICDTMYRQDRIKLLIDWLVQVPDTVLKDAPLLCFYKAWALARLGRADLAAAPLEIVERTWEAAGDDAGLAQVWQVRTFIDISHDTLAPGIERSCRALALLPETDSQVRARTLLMLGILHARNGELSQAEQYLTQSRLIAERTGERVILLIETSNLGTVLMRRGKLTSASALLQQVIESGDEWRDIPVQHACWELASIRLEQNNLTASTDLLERCKTLAEYMSAPLHMPYIHLVSAELAWSMGDSERAFRALDRAIEYGFLSGSQVSVGLARAAQARFWIASDQAALARSWADSLDLELSVEPEYPRLPEYMTLLRLLSYEDHDDRLAGPLDRVQHQAEQAGRLTDLLQLLLLRTIVESKLGNSGASRTALDRALEIGAPEGFIHSFLSYGRSMISPLTDAVQRGSDHREHATQLLKTLGVDMKVPLAPNASGVLSAREFEVLRLVATGSSNRDIGDALFISEETVKTHLRRIFEKLGVSNRTQAVAKGRELELFS